jgi:DNA-binding GntR family transcriptional regulator
VKHVSLISNKSDYMIKPTRSIADQIYDRTRSEIIKGIIRPGERLQELDVASAANSSRTPVREAFRRLEQDQLVERVARGGVRVISLDKETIRDLYELRTVLELHSIKLACQRISPQEIITLKQIRAQAMELLSSSEFNQDHILSRFMDLNTEFHETIYRSTGSRFLINVVVQLRAIVQSMRYMSIQADNSCTRAWDEHSKLIHFLEQRDVAAAQELLKRHVQNASQEVLSVMENQKLDE